MITEFLALPDPVLMSASGFFVGLLVGLTGVGAGALTTPLLISGFGVAPAVAVGTDLLFAGLTKIGGAWRHHQLGHVNWKILGYLAAGSILAALATLALIFGVQSEKTDLGPTIKLVLAATLVMSAIAVPLIPVLLVRRKKTPSTTVASRPLATIAMGAVIGAIVTLTSVGAGAIGVAVLTLLYPMLRARHIVGTDIVHAVPLTLLSGTGHLSIGNVDYAILAALLIGSVPGIMIGSRLTSVFPDWLLRLILAAVLASAAYLLIVKA
ncbi:MAG: sulfite exporter TauE/SafE family protein [Filomicrobium sp.]